MVSITAVLAVCAQAYAVRGADLAGRHFHRLFQFQLFGLSGAFLTGDLFNLFVFFEVLLIASYALLLHGGGRERTRAGLHYVVLNLIGSTLFLFAIGGLYGILGTLNMADLAIRVAQLPPENLAIVRASALLLFVVFALKAALVPLQLWLPGAYSSAGAPVAALFAIMTKVGAYSILRVYTLIFGTTSGSLAGLVEPWLLGLGLLTIVAGTVGAMVSTRLARLTASLVVVSAGTLLMAIGLGGATSLAAGLYYLAHSTFAAAALFLLTDILKHARGSAGDRLEPGPAFAGSRILGGLFLIIAVAIAGMPPLSGFVGKFLILSSSAGNPWMPWVFGIVLLTSLLIIASLARGGSRLFFEENPATDPRLQPWDKSALFAPVVLTAVGMGLVIFAEPLYEFSRAAADQLLAPGTYVSTVLTGATGGTLP
jgi:multicomponent K+:H+ antiporter subunit D